MTDRARFFVLVLLLGGCQTVPLDESTSEGADEPGTSDESESTSSGGESPGEDDEGATFNCDPGDPQPCPDGQKCTVLGSPLAPVYDCVTDDGALLPYEACTPAFANGQDGCPAGYSCLPISADEPTSGLCLQLCQNDLDCELALCAAGRESAVKVCAAVCDPLAPGCPESQDCQRVRQSAFVCQFPGPEDVGGQGDACDGALDAGCTEGFVCQTGAIVPDCGETNCCTALCDLGDADPCTPPTVCGDLDLDALPGLETIGACYVPQ